MKHVLIAAHPRADSLTLHLAQAYAQAVTAQGQEALLRDLARLGFNPLLQPEEMPDHAGFQPGDDVRAERDLLHSADVFALFHPLWLNGMPALLKGYLERVFGMGFAFSPGGFEGAQPLLGGKRLIVFSTSGAPQPWVEESGAWAAIRSLDGHFAQLCGLTDLGRVNFGAIHPGIRADVVERCAEAVRAQAQRVCGAAYGSASA